MLKGVEVEVEGVLFEVRGGGGSGGGGLGVKFEVKGWRLRGVV